ncbi:unnamed protein product, partial [Mesorhabditis spiculigera]
MRLLTVSPLILLIVYCQDAATAETKAAQPKPVAPKAVIPRAWSEPITAPLPAPGKIPIAHASAQPISAPGPASGAKIAIAHASVQTITAPGPAPVIIARNLVVAKNAQNASATLRNTLPANSTSSDDQKWAELRACAKQHGLLDFLHNHTRPDGNHDGNGSSEEAHVEARKDLPLAEIMFASFIGSIPQLIPSIPVEAVKTRLQFQTEGYASASARFHGPWDCARKMWKAEGIRAIYRGGNVMAVRDCFGNLFYLPVYETLHRFLKNRGSNTTAAQLIAGGCAGSISWLSICPLEVIKSRIQIADTPRSTLAVGREILAAEGWRSFYKGGLSMVLRGFPVNAIIFLVYEQCLLFMEKEKTAS